MNDKEFAQQIFLILLKKDWAFSTAIVKARELAEEFNKVWYKRSPM